MTSYAEMLMQPITKGFVLVMALLLIACGIYGTLNTSLSFDYKIVGNADNEHVKWITTTEEHFPTGNFAIDVVLDQRQLDYTSGVLKNQFLQLNQLSRQNEYFDSNKTVNWFTMFLDWKQRHNITGDFYPTLHLFLSYHEDMKLDIVFGPDKKIVASRVHFFTKPSWSWTYRKNAMVTLRSDLKKKTALSFYPVTFFYIYASHLSVIIQSTMNNVGICSLTILIITLPYVVKPSVSLLLLFSFLSFILELLAAMYVWGLSLNSITMIVMVMAIGFTVDYSCHVTHAYLTSAETTPEKRVVDAISSIGLSVLNGGLSTLAGVIVLSISTSKLFFLFFKMMFTIILLGLVHGLIILPVLMTIFCRKEVFKFAEDETKLGDNYDAKEENSDFIKADVNTNAKDPLIVRVTSL